MRLTEPLFPAPLDPGLHVGSKPQSTISSCQQDTAKGPIRWPDPSWNRLLLTAQAA